jgi:hypothetical protein
VLEDISGAVADILTRSQIVVAGHAKKVPAVQMDQLTQDYNDSEVKWMSMNNLHAMRLEYLFGDRKLATEWKAIRAGQEQLDAAIYSMSCSEDAAQQQQCMELIAGISSDSAALCRRMLTEINAPPIVTDFQQKGAGI